MAGLVVFLVALPLCLGIAMASGAPLFAGIIAGIIGGIVVGLLSGSPLSVSGPAAGLTSIVLTAIATLGSYEAFLLAVVLAGVLQLLLGYLRAGTISNYIPMNVIDGMLVSIGIIIILKQIPHAIGYDKDNEGDFFFIEKATGSNTFGSLVDAVNYAHAGAIIVALLSVAILVIWPKLKFIKALGLVPAALVVVLVGVLCNELFARFLPYFHISSEHLVSLPVFESFAGFYQQLRLPDWSAISRQDVWITAVTLAVVASIETLLCIEAADKMDPLKRLTSTNRELKAQGIGNLLSGLLGGLPMTSVIVRTTANVNSGGKTKLATVAHGVFLLFAVLAIPFLLNRIPLASLAGILIMIGYKLANPALFVAMFKKGHSQFVPFLVTVLAVVFSDLLKGVAIGLAVSACYILYGNMKLAYFFHREKHQQGETIHINLAQEVSFLNKAAIKQTFAHLPHNSKVVINAENSHYIDHDVLQLIQDFLKIGARDRNIHVTTKGFKQEYKIDNAAHVVSV